VNFLISEAEDWADTVASCSMSGAGSRGWWCRSLHQA